MAGNLKPGEGRLPEIPETVANRPDPSTAAAPSSPPQVHPPASAAAGLSLGVRTLIMALIAASLFLGWRAYYFEEEGDPVASAMFAFEKQNSLVVFSSRFEVVAEAEYQQTIAAIPVRRVRQAMIVPATVDYRIDLSGIEAADFEWEETTQTLTVTVPQVQTSTPNIDEAGARLFTEGVLNTGGSQQMLSKKNSEIAQQKASTFAKSPEILSLVRPAAKEALRQNLTVPLQMAGFDNARVEVRFEGN